MTSVYEGAPDSRQSTDVAMPTSRFRPVYRALAPEEKALHDAIKAKATELESLFEQARALRFPLLPVVQGNGGDPMELVEGVSIGGAGQYFWDGMTALELAVMWTVKGLTA